MYSRTSIICANHNTNVMIGKTVPWDALALDLLAGAFCAILLFVVRRGGRGSASGASDESAHQGKIGAGFTGTRKNFPAHGRACSCGNAADARAMQLGQDAHQAGGMTLRQECSKHPENAQSGCRARVDSCLREPCCLSQTASSQRRFVAFNFRH